MTPNQPLGHRRLFAALIGLTVVRDLLCVHVPQTIFPQSGAFTMPWLTGLPLPAASPMTDVFALVALVSMATAAGFMVLRHHTRLSAVWLVALYGWAFLSEQRDYTSNQYLLLLCLGLIAVWRPTGRGTDWGRWAGRLLISSVYLTAVIGKLDPSWLSGFVFDESVRHYGTVWGRVFGDAPLALAQTMAVATVAVEALLLVGLWHPRLRRAAIIVGVAFHVGIEIVLPVRAFSYVMVAGYALFITPAEAQRWVQRITPRWLLIGLAGAFGIAGFFRVIEVYPLPAENALWVVIGLGVAWWWTARSNPTPSLTGWPPRLAAAAAGLWLLVHVTLLAKPAFGGDDRFAFRMFRQVLIVKADTRAKLEGRWMKFPMHGAAGYWPEDAPKYYWESWTEHRRFLQAYAEWALSNSGAQGIRVVARVRVNGGAAKTVVFSPGAEPTSR